MAAPDVIDLCLDTDDDGEDRVRPAGPALPRQPRPAVPAGPPAAVLDSDSDVLDLLGDDDDEDGGRVVIATSSAPHRAAASDEDAEDDDLLRPVFRSLPSLHAGGPPRAHARPPLAAVLLDDGDDEGAEVEDSHLGDDHEDPAPGAQRELRRRKRAGPAQLRMVEDAATGVVPKRPRMGEDDAARAAKEAVRAQKAAERKAEKSRKAEERVRAREEKERVRAERQRAEIIARFARFDGGAGAGTKGGIAVRLPAEMVTGREGKKLLARVEAVFPGQVVVDEDADVVNAVRWARRVVVTREGSGEGREQAEVGGEVELAVVCFEAEQFCENIQNDTVDGLARHVLQALRGKRVEFALAGVESYCKGAASRAARALDEPVASAVRPMILAEEIVRDTCMLLYMEYGIVTRRVKNWDALCDYLTDITLRIARAPLRKPVTFLEANRAYRRALIDGRTTGVCADGELRAETSSDHGTVYLGFLVLIPGVSIAKAKAIRQKYPTLRNLLDAYASCPDASSRDTLLSELRYTSNGRRLGPASSALIAKVFTSTNGDALIHTGAAPTADVDPGDTAATPLGSQQ